MNIALEQSWRQIFALAADAKAAKQREEQMRLFYQDMDREKTHKMKVKEKQEFETKYLEDMIATTAQIAAFDQHLDAYDTCTVHALMENREALDRISDELRKMKDNAYVLPDGRRAFKTADGRRVFDEQGGEVPASTVDPHAIDGRHPTWEVFKTVQGAETKLEDERHELLEFQAKIDDARSRASKGDLTKGDLDALDADLRASAPPAVRQKLGLASPDAGDSAKLQSDRLAALPQDALTDSLSRRAQPLRLSGFGG